MTSAVAETVERTVDDLPFLDIDDPSYIADRPGVLRAAREQDWIIRTRLGVELLTYDTCWSVRQGRVVTGFQELPKMAGIEAGRIVDHFRVGFAVDGPEHVRIRQAASAYFARKSIERLREQCRAIVDELLDAYAPGEPVDLVALTNAIPARVFLAMINMPASDTDFITRISGSILKLSHRDGNLDAAEISGAYDELMEYAEGIQEERRKNPGDDLISTLALNEANLDSEVVLAMLAHLLFGSGDNSSAQIALTLHGLTGEQDQWTKFRADRSNVRDFATETMRMFPRQVRNPGFAIEDMVWGGVAIPKGTSLIGNVAAGNRDPEAFDDPETFNGWREQKQPLIFGSGPHICIGSHLARMEVEETLMALADRWERFELTAMHQDVFHFHDEFDELVVTPTPV